MSVFIRFQIVIAVLGVLATFLAGFYINKWVSPKPITSPEAPPVLQEDEGRLIYAYKIEKGEEIRTGFLGLGGKTNIYYVILSVTNHGKYKLNKVRMNLDLSNNIILHGLPYQYDVLDDKGKRIDDLSEHFANKSKAVITIPFLLPEQTTSMWFVTRGKVDVNDVEIYSEEVKGTKGEFVK